ncbi:type II secretion system protein N [Oxalobacteraceae bacterium R-40]|uniref:Type II secretion system protein N n=1 Tax=Keguizhuia sedimenti TaxID=3064264 RepID=A0ABU1BJU1_9BURK|nr:type II secretion system protein N [Oxalobacteraceae bacterium R-40]
MKRWPLVASFVLFIALCASLAYWAMQFFKPPVRPVAAPPPSVQAPPNIDAAASLFGGKGSTAVASNFQLKGVIMSGTAADSVAILVADGKPAQAVRVNAEVMPGVKVKEVNRRYVVLSDNGVEKRVELPEDSNLQAGVEGARAAPVATAPMPPRPAPAMPAKVVNNPAPSPATPNSSSPASQAAANPAMNPATNAAGSPTQQVPGMAPGSAGNESAAAPPAAVTQSSPPPPSGGMGSPPITNQGSLAGTASNPGAPATPVVPGIPVNPRIPRP